jgi:arabinofuranosyltransferase
VPHSVRRPPAGSLGWIWLLAAVAGFLAMCWFVRSFVTDDAWITARYAKNLADGYGFVWNPGGTPTEGFSHPLLFAIEALSHRLGLSSIETARAGGVLCGVGLLTLIYRSAPAVVGTNQARVALGLTALYPPLAIWAVGGLETLATALVITAGVLLLAHPELSPRRAALAGCALAVLPWLRPEGLILALAVAAIAVAPRVARSSHRRAAAACLGLAAGLPLLSQLGLIGVRLVIYGHLLPNSLLYKAGSGGTYDVLVKFVEQAAPLLALALAGVFVARGRQRLLLVPLAVYAVGSVGALDSVNGLSRFFLPVWPQLALLAGLVVIAATRRLGRAGAPVATAATLLVVAAAVLALPGGPSSADARYPSCQHEARRQAALWLRVRTEPGTVFSVSDSGQVPARAGARTAIDQFMLNDSLIQRRGRLRVARRADVVLDRKPDVIVLASTSPKTLRPPYKTDREVARASRFRSYRQVYVARGEGASCRYHLFIFRRGTA